MILLDTCLLIDHLRGREAAADYLESLVQPPLLSALTVAELYAGVREGEERKQLDTLNRKRSKVCHEFRF